MSLSDRLTTSGRVAAAVTAVLLAGVVLLSLVAFLSVSRRLAADADRSLVSEAEAFAAAIGPETARQSADLVEVSRSYLSARTGAETENHPILLVRFASGKVLSNSSVPLESAPGNAALLATATADRAFTTLYVDGNEYRTATVPVTSPQGEVLAVFEAALSTGSARAVARQLGWTLFGAGMAVVLLGAAVSALVAQASLRRLRRASQTAAGIGQTSLGVRVPYSGPSDDVGQMVTALNSMLDRLEAAFAEQRRFVADASHELRTPLAVVRGHLELVQRTEIPEDAKIEEWALIADELDRMDRLVNDLLKLARLEAGPSRAFQPLEVCTLTAEAVARCKALSTCPVAASCTPGEIWVSGDPDELMQALLNLLRNAMNHTPPTGDVVATVRADSRTVQIDVADSGPGIRTEDLPRLFDRFYRSAGPRSGETGGSGLGLAITKRLIELHGGRISAANRDDGRGAVFTIRLPRIPAPKDSGA